MKPNITLPYVPPPYDGEILGSWLGRIELLNGNGAWNAMIADCGFKNSITTNLFDLSYPDERFNNLLSVIGIDYNMVLENFSTIRFWRAFNPAADFRFNITSEVDKKTDSQEDFSNSENFGSKRIKNRKFRWHCPECIDEDVSNNKMPYWRIVHQLPTSIYCHRHEIPLEKGCSTCGTLSNPIKHTKIGVLTLFCACGVDRRTSQNARHAMPSHFKRLSAIGEEALAIVNVDWSKDELRKAAKLIFQEKSQHSSMFEYFVSEMQGERNGINFIKITTSTNLKPFQFGPSNVAYVAAVACASANISLCDAIKAYRNFEISNPSHTEFSLDNCHILGIKGAKEDLARLSKKTRPDKTISFQYLNIYDPKFLNEINMKVRDAPSIEDDRVRVLNDRQKKNKSRAVIRAQIRDKEWFDGISIKKKLAPSYSPVYFGERTKFEKADQALKVIKKILKEENRPKHITYAMIGNRMDLTPPQTFHVFSFSPSLKRALLDANKNKVFRMLRWAYAQVIKESDGQEITLSQVFKKAKLAQELVLSNFLRQIIAEQGDPIFQAAAREKEIEMARQENIAEAMVQIQCVLDQYHLTIADIF